MKNNQSQNIYGHKIFFFLQKGTKKANPQALPTIPILYKIYLLPHSPVCKAAYIRKLEKNTTFINTKQINQ